MLGFRERRHVLTGLSVCHGGDGARDGLEPTQTLPAECRSVSLGHLRSGSRGHERAPPPPAPATASRSGSGSLPTDTALLAPRWRVDSSRGSWGLTRRRAWGRCREEAEFGDVPRLALLVRSRTDVCPWRRAQSRPPPPATWELGAFLAASSSPSPPAGSVPREPPPSSHLGFLLETRASELPCLLIPRAGDSSGRGMGHSSRKFRSLAGKASGWLGAGRACCLGWLPEASGLQNAGASEGCCACRWPGAASAPCRVAGAGPPLGRM